LEVKAVCSESRTHGLTGAEFPQGDLATLQVEVHSEQLELLKNAADEYDWNRIESEVEPLFKEAALDFRNKRSQSACPHKQQAEEDLQVTFPFLDEIEEAENRSGVRNPKGAGRKGQSFISSITADTRRILFGNVSCHEKNRGRSLWKSVRLQIEEPRYGRTYEWNWNPLDFRLNGAENPRGLPDEYAKKRILELKNDRFASRGDYGYSGWIQFPDEEFLCVYHHGDGTEPGYQRGATAHILGTRFYETDFST